MKVLWRRVVFSRPVDFLARCGVSIKRKQLRYVLADMGDLAVLEPSTDFAQPETPEILPDFDN